MVYSIIPAVSYIREIHIPYIVQMTVENEEHPHTNTDSSYGRQHFYQHLSVETTSEHPTGNMSELSATLIRRSNNGRAPHNVHFIVLLYWWYIAIYSSYYILVFIPSCSGANTSLSGLVLIRQGLD